MLAVCCALDWSAAKQACRRAVLPLCFAVVECLKGGMLCMHRASLAISAKGVWACAGCWPGWLLFLQLTSCEYGNELLLSPPSSMTLPQLGCPPATQAIQPHHTHTLFHTTTIITSTHKHTSPPHRPWPHRAVHRRQGDVRAVQGAQRDLLHRGEAGGAGGQPDAGGQRAADAGGAVNFFAGFVFSFVGGRAQVIRPEERRWRSCAFPRVIRHPSPRLLGLMDVGWSVVGEVGGAGCQSNAGVQRAADAGGTARHH